MDSTLITCKRMSGRSFKAKFCHMLAIAVILIGQCGCASTQARTRTGNSASSSVPDALLGVWYVNDGAGRKACRLYRKARSKSDLDVDVSPLIGGLIITRNLLHGYSEYGEGNFYSVKRVHGAGDKKWKVDVLLYLDSYPGDEEYGQAESLYLALESGMLSMRSSLDDQRTRRMSDTSREPRFFRCGDLIEGLYEERGNN